MFCVSERLNIETLPFLSLSNDEQMLRMCIMGHNMLFKVSLPRGAENFIILIRVTECKKV